MMQRISVRIQIVNNNKVLLVRRSDGRPSILGKYEIPGGRVLAGEQPEDAAKRFMITDIGLPEATPLRLDDTLTFIDSDDRSIQYAVIVYRAVVDDTKRAIKLSSHYDKFVWYSIGKIDTNSITDVSRIILGSDPVQDLAVHSMKSDSERSRHQGPVVYTDGGSRGNPGPSAAGYVVLDQGKVIDQGGEYIGITTNNQAEYHGVKIGLEAAERLGLQEFEVKMDSMLVVNQLNNIYKVKNRDLWPINEHVKELSEQFKRVKFSYIPREMNRLADGMVNRTLDQHKDIS